jgi:hypothetical protein
MISFVPFASLLGLEKIALAKAWMQILLRFQYRWLTREEL